MRVRPDQLDLECLEELALHRGWRMYRDRQQATLAHLVASLEHAKAWEDVLRIRGRIEQARCDLNLAKVISDEIRARRSS